MAGRMTLAGRCNVLNGTGLPATLWLQHHTADPGEGATAPIGGRQAFTHAASTDGTASNVSTIDHTVPAAATYSHWSVWDAVSGGNCWWVGQWNLARTYIIGDTARVTSGSLTMAIV